ncbi:N-acetylneuraminate synthase family protein [Clostridium sp.]|uniref:N-acetylneuraminate synthase family protein n=1 Tax=Clostridium sp. TaxID=1506 RepID=UPI002FDEEF67
MKRRIKLGNIEIGEGLPTLMIAEIGLNHNGSIELAREMIKAAALSGANMVKFQKRCPENLAISSFLDAPFLKCPLFGSTQREVRNKLELNYEQIKELKRYSEELGLLFSMSVFDNESLKIAQKLNLQVIKLASHSATNAPLLEEIAKLNVPVILSMGGCTWKEKDKAFNILKDIPLAILHCISAYPCPESLIKLDTINELKKRYNVVVGYSGHENGIDISVAASVIGASIIERHFTLNRSMVGLDHKISLHPSEFSNMVSSIRTIEKSRGLVEGIAQEEIASRENYHVAVCTKKDMKKGDIIKLDDIVCKQPLGKLGENFSGFEISEVVGKELLIDLNRDVTISKKYVK